MISRRGLLKLIGIAPAIGASAEAPPVSGFTVTGISSNLAKYAAPLRMFEVEGTCEMYFTSQVETIRAYDWKKPVDVDTVADLVSAVVDEKRGRKTMTNPMIERVIAAMKASMEERAFVHGNRMSDGILPAELNFDGTIELEYVARAAIEAMREPTEAMNEAGEQADLPGARFGENFRESSVMEDDAAAVWRAMIDAALKDEA